MLLWQRQSLEPAVGEQEDHQPPENSHGHAEQIKQLDYRRKFRKIGNPRGDGLGDSHESSSHTHDEPECSEEDVQRHEGHSQRLRHGGIHVEDESEKVLGSEQNHGAESDPGMQRVEVGPRRHRRVVGIKDSDQPHDSADERHDVNCAMDDFQVLLARVAESSIDENGWEGKEAGLQSKIHWEFNAFRVLTISIQENHPEDH